MLTLYYIFFCGVAAFVCYVAMRNDDGEEFNRERDDGKFRIPKKKDPEN